MFFIFVTAGKEKKLFNVNKRLVVNIFYLIGNKTKREKKRVTIFLSWQTNTTPWSIDSLFLLSDWGLESDG